MIAGDGPSCSDTGDGLSCSDSRRLSCSDAGDGLSCSDTFICRLLEVDFYTDLVFASTHQMIRPISIKSKFTTVCRRWIEL